MLSVAALRHALMELIPEPQGLSFKETQQRVTLVARAQDWKGDVTGVEAGPKGIPGQGDSKGQVPRVNE